MSTDKHITRDHTMHVICIGGSGLRVLRSFIMLLLSGYDIPGYKIKPYIVDPHLQSNDLKFATELLANYQAVYSDNNKGFAKVPLVIDDLSAINIIKISNNQTFGNFIGYNEMKDKNAQYLVDMLYNDINIKKSMTVGFKGSPNVGNVVFQEFVKDSSFRNDFGNFTQNDKVILLGSLFGGTGASGIPTIAKALKSMYEQLPIAAVTLTPYFQLKDPDPNATDKEIDSTNFETKSLAALNYYSEQNEDINTFYVLGDTLSSKYDYDEVSQGNKAHFIEIVAATAIKDFAQKQVLNSSKNADWEMFFVQNDKPKMDYDDCGNGLDEVLNDIASFYAFSKFLHLMKKENRYPFYKQYYKQLLKEGDNASTFETLEKIIFNEDSVDNNSDSFIRWLGEIRDNNRTFNAINTDDIISPSKNEKKYQFNPTTPNKVFNGTEKLKDLDMSQYFLAINKTYRRVLKQDSQIKKVSDFLNICYEGIITENNK